MLSKIGIIRRNSGEFGGIEHQVVNIVTFLHSEFEFYLFTDDLNCKMAIEFSAYGKVIELPFKKRNFLEIGKKIADICKCENITLIQSHMPRESFYGKSAKFYLKNLTHFYRVHTYIDCSFISNWKKNIYHIFAKATDRYVDLYLPINAVNKKELIDRSRISARKIKILHNGVRPLEIKKDDVRDERNHNLALVGNLLWERGYDVALNALSEICKKDRSYKLYLIGGEGSSNTDGYVGSMKARIEKLIEELDLRNNVFFYGFTNDIAEAIKNCSIVILPAYDAGTPNCLLEAMTIRKLVIASNVGGVPEFIYNGKTGFLHENKNYQALASLIESIDEIPKNEYDNIRNQGYEIWKSEFTIDAFKTGLREVYTKHFLDVRKES